MANGKPQFVDKSNPLKEKVPVRGTGNGLDMAAIERAEQALDDLSSNFDGWMEQEITQLRSAFQSVAEHGLSGTFEENLFRSAHDLKGQADTFGYPLVGQVADSLCSILEAHSQGTPAPQPLIAHHVDAITAMVRGRIKTDDDEMGKALVAGLNAARGALLTR